MKGHYRIRITPSELIRPFGVALNINDQFNKQNDRAIGAIEMVESLNKNWKSSLERAKNTSINLWKNLSL